MFMVINPSVNVQCDHEYKAGTKEQSSCINVVCPVTIFIINIS